MFELFLSQFVRSVWHILSLLFSSSVSRWLDKNCSGITRFQLLLWSLQVPCLWWRHFLPYFRVVAADSTLSCLSVCADVHHKPVHWRQPSSESHSPRVSVCNFILWCWFEVVLMFDFSLTHTKPVGSMRLSCHIWWRLTSSFLFFLQHKLLAEKWLKSSHLVYSS